jgi:hypothetical protein
VKPRAAIALILLMIACAEAGAQPGRPPQLDYGVRPGYSSLVLDYPEPAEYEVWWHEIAACERLPLPPIHFQVQYFAVAAREFWPMTEGGWAIGYAHVWGNQLYLAFPYLDDKAIVEHEMLHFLMYWQGEEPGHPESRYGEIGVGKCGVVPYRRPVVDER